MQRGTIVALVVATLTFCTAIIENWSSIWALVHPQQHSQSIERSGWIGLAKVTNVSEEKAAQNGMKEIVGAYVAAVTPGSPAEIGGIKAGDVIVSYGATFISDPRILPEVIRRSAPGSIVSVRVYRGARELALRIQVSEN